MPASGKVISSDTALDTTAGNMTVTFNDSFSGIYWFATDLRLRNGPQPSTATIKIPIAGNAFDETAPTVACVAGGPLAQIKHGMRVKIEGKEFADKASLTVMIGSVTDISGDLAKDHGVIEVQDDRYLLAGMQLIGSFWADGLAGTAKYRQGVPGHVNPRGAPNCTLVTPPSGGDGSSYFPVFCTPWLGLNIDDVVPDTKGNGSQTNRGRLESGACATWWTRELLLDHIRVRCSAAVATLVDQFKWYQFLPDSIIWAPGLPSALTDGDRRAREMILGSISYLDAIQQVVSSGPNSIGMTCIGDKSSLDICPEKYTGQGLSLKRPSSGAAEDAFAVPNVITEGSFTESSRAVYTKLLLQGDLVYIEKRLASERTTNVGTYGFVKAWDTALQNQLKAAIEADLNGVNEYKTALNAFNILTRSAQFRKIGAAYRFAADYALMAGTSEEDFPQASTPRTPLPHQLTSYLEGNTAATAFDSLQARGDVYFEYSTNATTDSDGDWVLGPLHDGFAIDATDGTIWLTALRTAGLSMRVSQAGASPNIVVTLTPNALRGNVAYPSDHAVHYALRLGGNSTENVPGITDENSDDDRIDENLQRMFFADAHTLYRREIRAAGSYPTPATSGGLTDVEPIVLQDDEEQIALHAEERLKKLGHVQRCGRLVMPHLNFTIRPGESIQEIVSNGATFPIRGIVTQVSYHADDGENYTEIELA